MRKVAIIIAYNGRYFKGFQRQPDQYAVENALEEVLLRKGIVLSRFSNKKVGYSSAGRTDKGVHAVYQVISFNTQSSEEEIINVLNNNLAPKITAWGFLENIPWDFNARHWAKTRVYMYYMGKNCLKTVDLEKIRSCMGLKRSIEVDVKNIVCGNSCFLLISSHGFTRSEIRRMVNCIYGKNLFKPGNLCLVYVGYPFKPIYYFEYLRMFLKDNISVEFFSKLDSCFSVFLYFLYFL